jgi:hypothetical protein
LSAEDFARKWVLTGGSILHSAASSDLALYQIEGFHRNNRRMAVCDVKLWQFALIFLRFVRQKIGRKTLLEQGVASGLFYTKKRSEKINRLFPGFLFCTAPARRCR